MKIKIFTLFLVFRVFYMNLIDIFLLADIHLDLLYDSNSVSNDEKYFCKNKNILNGILNDNDLGKFFCNSNLNLLHSSLSKMQSINPNPKLILLGGDSVSHFLMDLEGIDNNKVFNETVVTIREIIGMYFKDTPILPIFGNNDFKTGYTTPFGNEKYNIYKSWIELYFNAKFEGLENDFLISFMNGGFYSYEIGQNLEFLILNSLLFCKNNLNLNKIDAYTQLYWLNKKIKSISENKKIIIFSHIGPFPQYMDNKTNFYWEDEYLQAFEKIVNQRSQQIFNINFHRHYSNFAVLLKKFDVDKAILPSVILPALSPIRGNNPAFSLLQYNNNESNIEDIKTFHLDLNLTNEWNIEYSFKKDFNIDEFNARNMLNFIESIVHEKNIFEIYTTYRIGYHRSQFNEALIKSIELGVFQEDKDFLEIKCNMISYYFHSHQKCLKSVSEIL